MPTCGLFCGMMGMGVIPVLAGGTIYFGMWYLATRVGDDIVTAMTKEAKALMDKGEDELASIVLDNRDRMHLDFSTEKHEPRKGLPMRWHHLQRGYMQLYLFTFMPITRRCVELLFCREVSDGGEMREVLVSDLSLECWTGPHMSAAVMAFIVLFFYAVFVPYFLWKRTSHYMATRTTDKTLEHPEELDDVDYAASCCDPRSYLNASRTDDSVPPDMLAKMRVVPPLTPKCWDELVKATRPKKFGWFIYILVLKLAVNVIFLVGQTVAFNWGMWLLVLLVFSALLSAYQQPYVLKSDNRQEQMSFLGLSLILSITNSGLAQTQGEWQWYHVVVVVVVVVLSTGSMMWAQIQAGKIRSEREVRVARGEEDLKQFTRKVFSEVVPTFLLLKDEHRDRIRKCIQVESFQSGEVIYHEHDNATAFYILKEGLVDITRVINDGQIEKRVINDGQAFGAGALAPEPLKRVATATVSENVQDCLVLRLIRTDWINVFTEITDVVVEEIFDGLDHAQADLFNPTDGGGDGAVDASELKQVLMERWKADKEGSPGREDELNALVDDTVQRLMRMLDDDGDGRITIQELKNNLRKIPEDDYAPLPVEAPLDPRTPKAPPPSWLVARCPFHYFHVNPKTNEREGYTEVENQLIFEAQSKSLSSAQISEGIEVRFGENARSSKMPKPSHTGICQVNTYTQNTRIVEILDKAALVNSTVKAEAAPVEADDSLMGTLSSKIQDIFHTPRVLPTTAAVYRWPTTTKVLLSDRQPCDYFHVDPTNNRKEPFSAEDNSAIFTAQNTGTAMAVSVCGGFEVRFGSSAVSETCPTPSPTGICRVDLENQNTRVVVFEGGDTDLKMIARIAGALAADDVAVDVRFVLFCSVLCRFVYCLCWFYAQHDGM